MSPALAARIFAGLTAIAAAFQLALALGAPWGEYAMGGMVRGAFPPALRAGAVAQMLLQLGMAAVVLARADLAFPRLRRAAGPLAWAVTGLLAVSLVLNLITPSAGERMIWAPVVAVMALTALRVAASR